MRFLARLILRPLRRYQAWKRRRTDRPCRHKWGQTVMVYGGFVRVCKRGNCEETERFSQRDLRWHPTRLTVRK